MFASRSTTFLNIIVLGIAGLGFIYVYHIFRMGSIISFFGITSLPLAFTRWVQSTFSSHCPLSSKQRHWLTSAKVTIFSFEKYHESQELNLWQLGPEASILTIVLSCQLSQHHCHHLSPSLLFCFKVMLMRKFTSCCLSLRWKKRHQFDPSLASDALWGPRREVFSSFERICERDAEASRGKFELKLE